MALAKEVKLVSSCVFVGLEWAKRSGVHMGDLLAAVWLGVQRQRSVFFKTKAPLRTPAVSSTPPIPTTTLVIQCCALF